MPRSDKVYYVYIVASRSRTLYIGVTGEIELRLAQHRSGTVEGFPKPYRCHRLVYLERFAYINNAIAREKQLKGWLRARKVALIEQENPTWEDLSAGWGKPAARYDWRAEEEAKQVLRRSAPQDDND